MLNTREIKEYIVETMVEPSYPIWYENTNERHPISYSFQLPSGFTEFESLNGRQPSYVDKNRGIMTLGVERLVFRKAVQAWQRYANINVIEDDINPQFRVYKYQTINASRVVGYSHTLEKNLTTNAKFSYGIGFHADYFQIQDIFNINPRIICTALHESGHTFSLPHPFESSYSYAKYNDTTFSLMNYDDIFDGDKLIVPITPMPADIAAIQMLYGANLENNHGNTLYDLALCVYPNDLRAFLYEDSFSKVTTIASLDWDSGGIDTITAANVRGSVTIDMRPYGRSILPRGFVATPDMEIENVVGSKFTNRIYTNSLGNIVDIRNSAGHATIHTEAESGHDIFVGFKINKDAIILEGDTEVNCHLRVTPDLACDLLGESITATNSTTIVFDKDNTITLANVTLEDLENANFLSQNGFKIKCEKEEDDIFSQLYAIFERLPTGLFNQFICSFSQGSVITFLTTLSNDMLVKYGCTEIQIEIVNSLLRSMLMLYSGSIAASYTSTFIDTSMRYFGFSQKSSTITANIVGGLVSAAEKIPVLGAANFVAIAGGSFAGSQLTFWAHRKVSKYFGQPSNDIDLRGSPDISAKSSEYMRKV